MDTEIRAYLLCKAGEGLAPSTLYEYGLYLLAFNAACAKPLAHVTNDDIAQWLVQERARGLADASILARHRALRIFFNWCVANEDISLTKSPLRMKNPKIKKHLPRVAPIDSVTKLLALPAQDWVDRRNITLIYLLLDTGMRIGEALSLHVGDLRAEARLAMIPPGKDGEGRCAPFTDGFRTALAAYLESRPCSPWSNWLFVGSLHGKPRGRLTVGGARQMLRDFCAKAGVAYINPHSLRHLFATKALNDGIRVEIVSKILGHSSVDLTLRIYASLMTETIQREYDNLWKISRIP